MQLNQSRKARNAQPNLSLHSCISLVLSITLGPLIHLKNNDRALIESSSMQCLMEGDPDTSSAIPECREDQVRKVLQLPQNNPLSSKLREEAVQILERTDLTNDEIKKYYPNL